jgi:recombinational DNA repair protein RecT
MAKEITTTTKTNPLVEARIYLVKRRAQLASIVGSDRRVDRLITSGMIAAAEMRDKNGVPCVHQCEPMSIARSIMQAAMLGIDLTAGLGEGWLIKYGNQCTLSTGYRCWQRAAHNAGFDAVFDVVREGDHFKMSVLPLAVEFNPKPDRTGRIVGAFAAVYHQGRPSKTPELLYSVEWCSEDDLQAQRASSKAPDSPAWKRWEDRMHRKLPLVRAVKDLPIDWSGRSAKLLETEAISEGGGGYDSDFDDVASVVDGGALDRPPQPEDSTASKTERLLEERRRRKNQEPEHADGPREKAEEDYGPPAMTNVKAGF